MLKQALMRRMPLTFLSVENPSYEYYGRTKRHVYIVGRAYTAGIFLLLILFVSIWALKSVATIAVAF